MKHAKTPIQFIALFATTCFLCIALSSCQLWHSYPPKGLWYCEELNMTVWSEGKKWVNGKFECPAEMKHNAVWITENETQYLIFCLLLGGGDSLAIAEGENGVYDQRYEYIEGPFEVHDGNTILLWDNYAAKEYEFHLVSNEYAVDADGNLMPYQP